MTLQRVDLSPARPATHRPPARARVRAWAGLLLLLAAAPALALGTWSSVGSMNSARYAPTATTLKTQNTAELYDPTTKVFEPTGAMTAANGRFGHAALLLPNLNKVLIVGGKEGSLLGWSPLKSAELYDIATGAFIPVSDMTYARD